MTNDIEIEKVILGAIMLDKNIITEVITLISPIDFYEQKHEHIYKTAIDLFTESQSIDILTIKDRLQRKGLLQQCGGASYLSELTDRVAGAAHIQAHCLLLKELSIKRQLIEFGNKIINQVPISEDIFETYNELNLEFLNIGAVKKQSTIHLSEAVGKSVKQLEEVRKTGVAGYSTGFKELDKIILGLKGGEFIIVAARPGMGKTTLAKNFAINSGANSLFYSLETSSKQLANGFLSMATNIPLNAIQTGDIKFWNKITEYQDEVESSKIYINDNYSTSFATLRAEVIRFHNKHGLELLIVDYLQLLHTKANNKEQEVSIISRGLKSLSLELDIPVVALSQLSRAVETRGGEKRPMLSDLRDSGAIEQDADIVIFPYRPEYYGIKENEHGESTQGLGELIVAKNRNGATGDAIVEFVGHIPTFKEISEAW